VRRAFAIISLSLMTIGIAICILVSLEPNMQLKEVAFECFSAYSTVGLSLGITAKFGTLSKLVLIVVMFIGRVSMLSILIAVMKNVRYKNYRYPTETILIN
jgi:trk system potassium uptake protein